MTPQEKTFIEFLKARTHKQVMYTSCNTCWFSRVGSNDEERVAVLEEAHKCLLSTQAGSNKMIFEHQYLQLYHDMKQNESQWFDDILSNPYNLNLCDGILVVLGTLASLKRNRDELQITGEILELDKRVIEIYDNRVYTPGLLHSFLVTDPQVLRENCEGL